MRGVSVRGAHRARGWTEPAVVVHSDERRRRLQRELYRAPRDAYSGNRGARKQSLR